MTRSPDDVRALLVSLGAPPRLLVHLALVGEAAEALLAHLRAMGVPVDAGRVRVGAACHDAGKVLHPEELDGPGSAHETAGEALLLEHGVAPEAARCCVSHARYATMPVVYEELVVALADKLWKGRRDEDLERRALAATAERLGRPAWEVFDRLDAGFESVAAGADERLRRSVELG